MKAYYFLGRLLRPFMTVAMYFYSYIFRTPRARVVLKNEQGEVLLVQSWLSSGKWGLPGGGLNRGESSAAAAVRELEEEVGIMLQESSLESLFTLRSRGHDEIVFVAHVEKSDLPTELPNTFEIKDAAWFSFRELPALESPYPEILDRIEK